MRTQLLPSIMEKLKLLGELKDTLEKAAFLVVSKAGPQEAHALVVKALVIVSRLEDHEHHHSPPKAVDETSDSSIDLKSSGRDKQPAAEIKEMKKVRNRLRLWSRKPQQINTRILKAYLELRRSGMIHITEQSLRSALPPDFPFESNFAQMKIIAEKNHGKVFETHGDHVEIWAPVEADVRDFERQTFGD